MEKSTVIEGTSPTVEGHPPSFQAVYDHYFGFVWRSARRMGVADDAMDDVVQDVFLVVHARLKTLERLTALRSWIYSVVRRVVSTHHRERRVRRNYEAKIAVAFETLGPIHPSPQQLALLSEDLKRVWHLLLRLDPLKREVFVLTELEEMTGPEIAQALGIPLNTVYSRLRFARQEFNDLVARPARPSARLRVRQPLDDGVSVQMTVALAGIVA
jgi:RNA polymerase sigma-70 factor (ECF subfamily)